MASRAVGGARLPRDWGMSLAQPPASELEESVKRAMMGPPASGLAGHVSGLAKRNHGGCRRRRGHCRLGARQRLLMHRGGVNTRGYGSHHGVSRHVDANPGGIRLARPTGPLADSLHEYNLDVPPLASVGHRRCFLPVILYQCLNQGDCVLVIVVGTVAVHHQRAASCAYARRCIAMWSGMARHACPSDRLTIRVARDLWRPRSPHCSCPCCFSRDDEGGAWLPAPPLSLSANG